MRIGMIAPPWLPIPPTGYGGIELVAYDLTEGLVERGHDVVLFAPGDSKTSARLVPIIEKHIGQDWPSNRTALNEAFSSYSYARAFLEGLDIVHDHTLHHQTGFPIPAVHTLHGPRVWGHAAAVRMSAEGLNRFVAISRRQRELYGEEGINWAGVVHNAMNAGSMPFSAKKDGYVLFVGRANWEKGLDLAVRVAVKARQRLVMAVKMTEGHEREYFARDVQPWVEQGDVTLLGEITPEEKFALYRDASCTIFSSQWEEPFGLVMTESMACGTPVVALKRGAAPEVIVHGVTGFVCEDEEEMVESVVRAKELDPVACREHVERHFSVAKMAADYEVVYRRILAGERVPAGS
jgi:glycosyltransferase involved in cell wall biosynthesis